MTPLQFFQVNSTSLTHDFLGFNIYPKNMEDFFLSLFFSVALVFFLFLFGDKVKRFFPKTAKTPLEESFLSLAFGHIIFATGIALLGVFSLLTPIVITIYMLVILGIGIFPLIEVPQKINKLLQAVRNFSVELFKGNKLISIGILLFLGISILRLLSPEIGVDAVFYHHDYPKEYLRIHSLMEYPQGSLLFLVTPQLGQMLYVVSEFFGPVYAQRIIHFLFFLIDLLVLCFIGKQKKGGKFAALPALLFAASPTVIGVIPSGYVDAQWLFLWLLTFWTLTKEKLSPKTLVLTALLYGGVMASKIQALPFMPAFLAYVFFTTPKKEKIKSVIIFLCISLIFPSLWYIRSIILTGSPLYPETSVLTPIAITNNFSFASNLEKLYGLVPNYNPFITLGAIASFVILFRKKRKDSFPKSLLFVLLLALNYTLLPVLYYAGRFLLFPYSILTTLSAETALLFFKKRTVLLAAVALTSLLFIYYVTNALLILPYGLGWANTNAYLTRVLSRDNASYYDFGKSFSPFITKTDYIGTYTIEGFFYADFSHRDVEYSIKQGDDFSVLQKAGFTKLLLKHGDMQWFCGEWKLKNCTPDKYTFLTSYIPAQQYLYELR